MEMDHRHDNNRKKQYLGCLSKQQLIIVCVTCGLVILAVVITVAAVLLSKKTDHATTGGDMLDFLVQSGDINRRDGLLVTWFHRANGKEELNQALASDAMVLEADVTLHGYGTADQKPIPIMAHPPNVTSDITLDQWLDAVLESRKGIKLDFKSLASVGLSLDLLLQKDSSRGIDRPVWLNADILKDPLVPGFIPIVNGTQFLELVQEKFPDVTLSLGWMVLAIYNRAMMEEMYAVVKDLPQKVTFPIKAVHVRSGWPHISWLLSQSSRFSLTLWQSSVHPTVEDLLLVRDNSHPEQVYYDIYEPTLTLFKQAVGLTKEQGRLRRFYPGGDLLDFMSGAHTQSSNQGRSLSVRLVSVSDHTSLSAALRDRAGGMLVLRVGADRRHPGVPVVVPVEVPVVPSSEILTLEEVLKELSLNPHALWGLYLRVGDPELLGASLSSLLQFYTSYQLYRPVWIGMDPQASCSVQEFVSTVNELFPHCTIVLNEAVPAPDLSQRLAVHLSSLHLSELHTALRGLGSYDVILETEQGTTELTQLMEKHRDSFNHNIYVMSKQS